MFDLSQLDTRTRSTEGVQMPVLHPKTAAPVLDAEGRPQWIGLRGRNSDSFRRVQREILARRADREARNIPLTEDDYERERFDTLCALTTGWSFDTMDGQPFPFTEENTRKLWSDGRWGWLATYAYGYALSEGNFIAA